MFFSRRKQVDVEKAKEFIDLIERSMEADRKRYAAYESLMESLVKKVSELQKRTMELENKVMMQDAYLFGHRGARLN